MIPPNASVFPPLIAVMSAIGFAAGLIFDLLALCRAPILASLRVRGGKLRRSLDICVTFVTDIAFFVLLSAPVAVATYAISADLPRLLPILFLIPGFVLWRKTFSVPFKRLFRAIGKWMYFLLDRTFLRLAVAVRRRLRQRLCKRHTDLTIRRLETCFRIGDLMPTSSKEKDVPS